MQHRGTTTAGPGWPGRRTGAIAWIALAARIGLLVAVAALTAAGCAVSPQTDPPNAVPQLDPTRVEFPFDPSLVIGYVKIGGGPAAVQPAAGIVYVTNLDRDDDAVAATVAADGSFEVLVQGLPEDRYRVQATSAEGRSESIDYRGADALTLVPLEIALACFGVERERDLGVVAVGSTAMDVVTLRNGCPDPVTVDGSMRRSSAGFSVADGTGPRALESGGRLDLVVRAQPISSGDHQEVLFVEASGAEVDRRFITLWVSATP